MCVVCGGGDGSIFFWGGAVWFDMGGIGSILIFRRNNEGDGGGAFFARLDPYLTLTKPLP